MMHQSILELDREKMIVVVLVSIAFLYWLLKDDFRKIQVVWNVPGPKALPLIGNGLDLVNKSSLGK